MILQAPFLFAPFSPHWEFAGKAQTLFLSLLSYLIGCTALEEAEIDSSKPQRT